MAIPMSVRTGQESQSDEWYRLIVGKAWQKDTKSFDLLLNAIDKAAQSLRDNLDEKTDSEYSTSKKTTETLIGDAQKKTNIDVVEPEKTKLDVLNAEIKRLELTTTEPSAKQNPAVGMVVSMILLLIAGTSRVFDFNGIAVTQETDEKSESVTLRTPGHFVWFLKIGENTPLSSPATKDIMKRAKDLVNRVTERLRYDEYEGMSAFIKNVKTFFDMQLI